MSDSREKDREALQEYVNAVVTPQAIKTATQLLTDRRAYGFSVLDKRTGRRVDPSTLRPVP